MEPTVVLSQLCLSCGLCCNGVLFKDVELQRADDRAALARAGLPLCSRGSKTTLPQPCHALGAENRCQVYGTRPNRCREFECALFKSTASGTMEMSAALKIVGLARQRAANVRRLLELTGDHDAGLPLSLRFKRVQRKFERGAFDEPLADAFGELTLAVHALNVLLSEDFYPGSTMHPPDKVSDKVSDKGARGRRVG